MMWIDIISEADLPTRGGTKAVIYHGVVAWMYFNPEKKTWHPANGWRKNMGQHWKDVTAYCELPTWDHPTKRKEDALP